MSSSDHLPARRTSARRLLNRTILLLAVLGTVLVGHAATRADGRAVPRGAQRAPIPADGQTYYGVQLSWDVDTPAAYATRLGRAPAVYGDFVTFPLSAADRALLGHKVAEIAAMHGMFMLTVMPNGGLATVTDAAAQTLGRTLAAYNRRGVPVFVRFGHEMNGSWYAWGQQPAAYVRAFRRVARAVHRDAPLSSMVWAPSYGGGYPFTGGRYAARRGTAAYAALDTNHDGRVTGADDPYRPYYPGDAFVDWVGLTDYFWGTRYPWGQNDAPPAGLFVRQVTGTGEGLPDFYATYAVGHTKPFVLAETSALYNPARRSGASDYAIKIGWARQVFAPGIATQFPRLKMLLWFEGDKYERETHSILDWTATCDRTVLAGFRATLPARLVFAPWRGVHGRTSVSWKGCPAGTGAR